MKQLYYVIRTLLRGRGSNIIKVISLGLGLTMSILLFSRVAFEQSYDTCYKDYDDLYQIYSIFSAEGEQFEPQKQNCGPVAGAILENFPKEVEAAASIAYFVSSPLYNGSVRIDARKILADSLFFKTMGIEVLSGNPEKDLMQNDVIFLSDDLAQKIYGGENPIGKVISYNKELQLTVKGTYVDLPENATMRPEAVISMPTAWSRRHGNNSFRTHSSVLGQIDISALYRQLQLLIITNDFSNRILTTIYFLSQIVTQKYDIVLHQIFFRIATQYLNTHSLEKK